MQVVHVFGTATATVTRILGHEQERTVCARAEEDSEMVVLPDSVSDSLEDQVAVKPPFGTT